MYKEPNILCLGIIGYRKGNFGDNIAVYKAIVRSSTGLVVITTDKLKYNNIDKPLSAKHKNTATGKLQTMFEMDPEELFVNQRNLPDDISGWPVQLKDMSKNTKKFVVSAKVVNDAGATLGYEVVYLDERIRYISKDNFDKYKLCILNNSNTIETITKGQMHPQIIHHGDTIDIGNYRYTFLDTGYPSWQVKIIDPNWYNEDEKVHFMLHEMAVSKFNGTYIGVNKQIINVNMDRMGEVDDHISLIEAFDDCVKVIDLSGFKHNMGTMLDELLKEYSGSIVLSRETYKKSKESIEPLLGRYIESEYNPEKALDKIAKAKILGMDRVLFIV